MKYVYSVASNIANQIMIYFYSYMIWCSMDLFGKSYPAGAQWDIVHSGTNRWSNKKFLEGTPEGVND